MSTKWAGKLASVAIITAIAMLGTAGTAQAGCDGCTTSAAVVGLDPAVTVAPTAAEMSTVAAIDRAGLATDTAASLPPLKCYGQNAWEYWNTNAGRLVFFNYTHWCARYRYHTYMKLTYGWAGSQRPPFWEMDEAAWAKMWATTSGTQITTIASAKLKLKDPTFGIVLQEHDVHMCMRVYSTGASAMTCHD